MTAEQQSPPFRGQLPADDKCLSDYCIGPNASIKVIMQPLEKTAPEELLQPQPQPLWDQLARVLAKHFGPQDAKAVLRLLRQEHAERLRRISLEDLEQLARDLLMEEPVVEPAEEREPEAVGSEPPDEEDKADQ